MATGALSPGDYPCEVVVLACSKCERRGRYNKARLVAEERRDLDVARPTAGSEIGLVSDEHAPGCFVANELPAIR
jgi:hypothetical protein